MKKISITVIVLLLSLALMAEDRNVAAADSTVSVNNATKEIVHEEISSIVVSLGGDTLLNRKPSYLTFDTDGGEVVANGEVLPEIEVRRILYNTAGASLYSKGISRYKIGRSLITWGRGFIGGGLGCIAAPFVSAFDSDNEYVEYSGEMVVAFVCIGVVAVGVGIGMLIPGLIIKSIGKRNIIKAVNAYNYGGRTASGVDLKLGFTNHGVGLVLTF